MDIAPCCFPAGERNCNSLELSSQELGVAKLRGFREWFSILIAESDHVEEFDPNSICPKMVIFAHHHKVLDGIQVRCGLYPLILSSEN